MKNTSLPNNDEDFFDQIVIPYHYQIAVNNSTRFGIKNVDEKIIICSNDFATPMGYNSFKEAINKVPDVDYPRQFGTFEYFQKQLDYLRTMKKAFHYIYYDKFDKTIYTSITEPIINSQGRLIGKKETDIKNSIFSHRELVLQHFKRFNTNVAALDNANIDIKLSEREEIIIFMLIAGFTQQEIGEFLGISRATIFKAIAENLCVKFDIGLVSTKLLIDKTIALGYANLIPRAFLKGGVIHDSGRSAS